MFNAGRVMILWVMLAVLLAGCGRAEPAGATSQYSLPPREPTMVKVAAIQFRSDFGDAAGNRKRLEPFVREAAKNGAKIVVLPETAITAYTSEDLRNTWQAEGWKAGESFKGVDPTPHAETVPGESTAFFGKLAKELGIYLTVPFVERSGEGKDAKFYNTIVLVNPAGEVVLHYRKLNPWPYAEQGWATKGDRGHQVIDTPYGRLGLLVCYDINFEPPALKKEGVDTLLYCIAWVDSKESRWFTENLPAIARENNLNIVGANWTVSKHHDWWGYGHSLIIRRDGEVLSRVRDDIGEEIIYAELPVTMKR